MKQEQVDLIIIRGAPASGKSQTAKELSHFFPGGARLEVDTLRQMVISVNWKDQAEHINMLEASTKLIFEFIRLNFKPVIVIDTFSGDKITRFLEIIFNHNENISVNVFGLFTTNDELKRRLALRSNAEFRDFAICSKLNYDVLMVKYNGEYQIDTTGFSAKQTARKIYDLVTSGTAET